MKSTYSVTVTATICWQHGSYELRLVFPAAIDCDILDEVIEDIECRDKLPDEEAIIALCDEYYMDDEPDVHIRRHYNLSVTEFGKAVHEGFDCDEEMYTDANSSVQRSFCRNCGIEGPSVEPDCSEGWCESCGQNACRSIAYCMGII